MKASIAGIAYFAACAAAVAQHKSVIVSYSEDTPNSVLEEAKAAIVKMVSLVSAFFGSPPQMASANHSPGDRVVSLHMNIT